MSDALVELEALREATRPRLAKDTVTLLRDHAEMFALGDKLDRKLAHGLELLLNMHDKLEAIRHGQG